MTMTTVFWVWFLASYPNPASNIAPPSREGCVLEDAPDVLAHLRRGSDFFFPHATSACLNEEASKQHLTTLEASK